MKSKRIEYEDDLVVVYDEKGAVAYRGIEDYDPNKYLDWRWDASRQCYVYKGWTKYCIG